MKIDLHRLAHAIAKQESGCSDMAVGANGERGRYQFQEQLWRSITPVFFGAAHDPVTATRVAIRHLEWLAQKLRKNLRAPFWTAYDLALAWKSGPNAVIHNFTTIAQREFAASVQLIYDVATPAKPFCPHTELDLDGCCKACGRGL